MKLIERVVTLYIFKNILDTTQFIDYTLVKNKELLNLLLTDNKNIVYIKSGRLKYA